MNKRAIVRIQLDLAAKRELDKLCDRRGMTQIAVMSRMVQWFVKQDEFVQTAVLGGLSDATLQQLARNLMEQIAAGKAKG